MHIGLIIGIAIVVLLIFICDFVFLNGALTAAICEALNLD